MLNYILMWIYVFYCLQFCGTSTGKTYAPLVTITVTAFMREGGVWGRETPEEGVTGAFMST